MPYDEKLADRVREVLGRRRGVTTGRPLTGMVYVGPRGHDS